MLKADIVWSSAMDLQYQMVEDGIAAEYASPEKSAIPEWVSYDDRIYGTTFEPVVMVYSSKIIADDPMPDTRQGLAAWLTENRAEMKRKLATYDPERSGLGFFAVNEAAKHGGALWPLVTAFGAVDANFYTSTGTMLEKISAANMPSAIVSSAPMPICAPRATLVSRWWCRRILPWCCRGLRSSPNRPNIPMRRGSS